MRTAAISLTHRLVRALAVALLASGAIAACSSGDPAADDEGPAITARALVEDTTTTTTVAEVGASDGGGTAGGSSGGGSTGGGSATGGGEGPGSTPTIVSFTTPEVVDCQNTSFQEFTASWSTTGAVEVSIAIDGPGVFAIYPANGEARLPFTCSTSHTFLLTAVGAGGQTATRSVVLQPRNARTPSEYEDV